jgi:hypothetical protein
MNPKNVGYVHGNARNQGVTPQDSAQHVAIVAIAGI